ncbi:hypothetical protein [Leeuwenhoekiella sp. NPDC079379]|uniref:hypothetical protein n=1 Tax=Leeuwenhoekiella sp. NPDC079379 TaxID=3364122 RepID=UPI0037C66477
MTKYEMIITPPTLAVIVKLIRNEITVDVNIIQQLNIYERFYQLQGLKKHRYKILAEEFNCSTKTISRIIIKMNESST